MKINPVRLVPLASLRNNEDNPKTQMGSRYLRGLRASLERFGFAGLFVVAGPDPPDGSFEVLDGNTRLEELDRAGVAEVPCVVLDLDHQARREFVLTHDRHKKPFDETKVVEQLRALAGAGRDLKELSRLTAVDGLRQIVDEANRGGATDARQHHRPGTVTRQPKLEANASLILYGPAEDVEAIKQLVKRIRGRLSAATKARQALEQADHHQDLSDEQFLVCFLSAVSRMTADDPSP